MSYHPRPFVESVCNATVASPGSNNKNAAYDMTTCNPGQSAFSVGIKGIDDAPSIEMSQDSLDFGILIKIRGAPQK